MASLQASLRQLQQRATRPTGPDAFACNRLAQDVAPHDVSQRESVYMDCVLGNLP